ncbi:hypothetical protein CR51_15180 [Caballeronia megalochromosomata]|nr:hypothetical protein CR51_15180 [Caballeronia megalochromosomata]
MKPEFPHERDKPRKRQQRSSAAQGRAREAKAARGFVEPETGSFHITKLKGTGSAGSTTTTSRVRRGEVQIFQIKKVTRQIVREVAPSLVADEIRKIVSSGNAEYLRRAAVLPAERFGDPVVAQPDDTANVVTRQQLTQRSRDRFAALSKKMRNRE